MNALPVFLYQHLTTISVAVRAIKKACVCIRPTFNFQASLGNERNVINTKGLLALKV